MEKSEIKAVVAYLKAEEQDIRAIAEDFASIAETYGTILGGLADKLHDYVLKRTVKSVKFFESEGFSREHALLLTLDRNARIKTAVEKMEDNHRSSNKKKK